MRAPRPLLFAGAGGFAREAAETVRAINAVRPTWRLLGFLDDDPARHGTLVSGVPVLGTLDLIFEYPDAQLVLTAGRPDNYVARRRIAERLQLGDDRYATLVHPSATIGESCTLGPGTVLLAHVDLTADVAIGRHVAAMPQVVLPHDVRIDDYATLASGVRVGGAAHIGEGAYVGAAACIRDGVAIGERALIGMGSLVTRDVPPERLWYGAPARDMGPAPLPRAARSRRPLPEGAR